MKILVISQYFKPESFRINDIVKSLSDLGHGLGVLTAQPNYPDGQVFKGFSSFGLSTRKEDGLDVSRVPIIPRGTASFSRLALNYLSFVISAAIFGPWLLRKQKFDVLFCYGVSPILSALPGILIARLKKVPFVLNVQDLWPQSISATGNSNNPFLLGLIKIVVRYIYQHSDLILVSSKPFIEDVKKYKPTCDVIYFPNSVGDEYSATAASRSQELPKLPDGFNVVFAGNVGSAQSINTIVDAADKLKSIPQIKFIIIGSGSESAWLKSEIEARALKNILALGRFPPSDMPYFFLEADALLVTLKDEDIFHFTVPNKIQAYMAAGRPIIASVPGEGGRIVKESGAGFHIAPENPNELASCVHKLYGLSKEYRDQLGLNGKAYFKDNFDHSKLIRDLVGYLEKVFKDAKLNISNQVS